MAAAYTAAVPAATVALPTGTITAFPTATPTIQPAVTQVNPTPAGKTPTSPKPPTPVATLDTLRRTPPTIMLHRSNPDFDSVKFLGDLVQIIKDHDLKVITYADITRQPDITALEQGHLFIITIDDVALQAPIDPDIDKMITILQQAGYPAVLGIITEGKLPDLTTAARLKELAGQGWELAMHTDTHVDLKDLAKDMPFAARLEIRTCHDKIQAATGYSAATLVLPFGDNVADLKILYREHVAWTVGIGGGDKYRTTNWTYYVGREGPDGDAQTTYNIMMARFNP